jgi:hypothetical protein
VLSGITEIHLYSAEGEWKEDSDTVRSWMEKEGIRFTELCYRDPVQHPLVWSAVNTWFPDQKDVTTFPFVVWSEVYEGVPDSYRPKKFLEGKEEILTSNLSELAQL